jgi:hypothetical protein
MKNTKKQINEEKAAAAYAGAFQAHSILLYLLVDAVENSLPDPERQRWRARITELAFAMFREVPHGNIAWPIAFNEAGRHELHRILDEGPAN